MTGKANELAVMICELTERVEGIERDLLRKHAAELAEQKHLDADSSERLYWHAGYASALRDILAKIQKSARAA